MAKNMTRKGLAIGAASALTVAGLIGVATPAQANDLIVLPNAGTSFDFVSGEDFTVKVIGASSTNAQLHWEISGVESDETVTIATAGTATADTSAGTISFAPDSVSSTAGANTLAFSVAADETADLQVRAYIESGDATGLSSFDTAGSAVSVNFIEAENVTATVSIDAAIEGDTDITGSFTTNVNNEQLDESDLGVEFTYADASTLTGLANSAVAAWDKDDNFVISADVSALAKDKAIKAEIFYLDGAANNAGAIAGESLGSATLLVAEVAADSIAGSTVSGETANATQALVDSTFQVKATVEDDSTPAKPVSGATVEVKVTTDATLSDSSSAPVTLTINGTTYDSNSELPGTGTVKRITTTTDADGEAFVTVTANGLTDGDTVTFDFDTENISSSPLVVTMRDASYTAYMDSAVISSSGSSASTQVRVYDQFGGTPENKYDILASVSGTTESGTGATASTAASNATLNNGIANLTVVDNGVGTSQIQFNVEMKERLAGNQYGSDELNAGAQTLTWNVVDAEDLVPGKIVLDGTGATQNSTTKVWGFGSTTKALLLEDLKSYDSERAFENAPSAYVSAFTGKYFELNGDVTTASSPTSAATAIAGATVTLSGEGLQFRDADGNYSGDSITVVTDSSGEYVAHVASNQTGSQTVTVTSGSVTETVTVTFDPAAEDTGTSLVIDAPTAVEPGSTLVYTATLTDKYGNPVNGGTAPGTSNAKFNYDGPGFVVGSTLPSKFGADGTATVTIFLGNNDDGKTGTLTVSYTPTDNDDATYAYDGDDDLVVQKTVNIGDVPLAAGEFNAWTKLIDNDTTVKFYAKNPSDQGKIQFFFNGEEIAWHRGTSPTSYEGGEPRYNEDQDAYYLVRDVELVSGMKNVFEIEQDGERIWRAVKTLD